jgi:hypothetical protein
MGQAEWARALANSLLAARLPRRWAHTRGVAGQARRIRSLLGNDAEQVEAAAWLHDIGYSPDLVSSGFHPLDGARYLRDVQDADEVLCRLVAYHSCADIEAGERGLQNTLHTEFAPPPAALNNALIYCDMTTDPDGQPTTVDDRLAEILARYGNDHVVSRAIKRSAPALRDSTTSVARSLAAHLSPSAEQPVAQGSAQSCGASRHP